MKMKKWATMMLLLVVMTAQSIPAMAAAASIKKTEYEGSGIVDVDFKKNVQYKNAKVTVKDSDGKSYTVKIREKDNDDLKFKVSNIAAGKTYSYTISGVRSGKSGSYGKVSGSFKVPQAAAKTLSIKELDYDRDDRDLEIEFNTKVTYKSVKVKVTDGNGKSYTVKLREKDNDSIDARVTGLKKGTKYTVKVSGVRAGSSGSYGSVSKSFTVR